MIGMNIKYLRVRNGMSQEAMAEKLGVTRQTIAKWESGESLPDVRKGMEVAAIFGVSLDEMVSCPLDEQEEPEEKHSDGKYVFGIVKVGERGQVVIPKHARQVYGIKAGDKILVVGDKRGMAFVKMKGFSDFGLDSE